ncbi:hypothetical protein AGLY_016266 [Aphis glycines]|uniref:Uncharacterized protein n=1 Tax=Aphis glycines TaxID=307491 RepID=A0A6G0SYU0_APHGL|nr:hypothetical protein AGLY_016266 [Aphis glycines]
MDVSKPHMRRNLIRELNSTKHPSFYNCKKNVLEWINNNENAKYVNDEVNFVNLKTFNRPKNLSLVQSSNIFLSMVLVLKNPKFRFRFWFGFPKISNFGFGFGFDIHKPLGFCFDSASNPSPIKIINLPLKIEQSPRFANSILFNTCSVSSYSLSMHSISSLSKTAICSSYNKSVTGAASVLNDMNIMNRTATVAEISSSTKFIALSMFAPLSEIIIIIKQITGGNILPPLTETGEPFTTQQFNRSVVQMYNIQNIDYTERTIEGVSCSDV